MTVNVLLTGAGGFMAHFIHGALSAATAEIRVVACDHSPDSVGLFRADVGCVVPSATDDRYVGRIVELCRAEGIHLLLVHGAAERRVLARHRDSIFAESGAYVVTPPPDVLSRIEDKWELTKYLAGRGFDHPRSVLPADRTGMERFLDEVSFPYVVKDRFGSGSKGLGIASDKHHLERLLAVVPNAVIQEYLYPDSEEYTVGVFLGPDGTPAASIVMRRELALGLTVKAQVLPDSPLGRYCELAAQGSGCLGPTNVQLRLTDRGPVVFEINARFSTTTSARCHYGYNEAEMCVKAFVLREPLARPQIRGGRFFRVIDDVFVEESDFDTLSARGRIEKNPRPDHGDAR